MNDFGGRFLNSVEFGGRCRIRQIRRTLQNSADGLRTLQNSADGRRTLQNSAHVVIVVSRRRQPFVRTYVLVGVRTVGTYVVGPRFFTHAPQKNKPVPEFGWRG